MSLNKLRDECHQVAVDKGFWEFGDGHIDQRPVPTLLMLIVSELAEACEADRKDRHADLETYDNMVDNADEYGFCKAGPLSYHISVPFVEHIKDTVEDEMADALIRILDFCGGHDIDIERHVALKLAYNRTRPVKHGKRY